MASKQKEIQIQQKEEMNKMKNQSIECILEDDSEFLQVKQEYDEDDENQMKNDNINNSIKNSNNKNKKHSKDGWINDNTIQPSIIDEGNINSKRTQPVVKMYYGKKYVVGMCSRKEQIIENEEDEKPIHYYPPKLILLNFPRPQNYDAQKQFLLLENSQFQTKFQEMNQNQDITTYLEQLVVGNSLNFTEKLEVRCFWFSRFFEYAQRHPPCCKRVKKFWEWVFMLNPQSNFKWRFKNFSLQWIELMTSYIEFRELFSSWIESFEQDILSELQDDKKKLFKTQLYSRYLKELLQMKNKSSFTIEDVESREDMQNQIINDGVIIKPEGYKESCICKRNEHDIRIGVIPKLNKVEFKYKMKIFKKNQEIGNLFTIKEAEMPINPPEENLENDDNENGNEDDDLEYDDQSNSSQDSENKSSFCTPESENSDDSQDMSSQNSMIEQSNSKNSSQMQQKSASNQNMTKDKQYSTKKEKTSQDQVKSILMNKNLTYSNSKQESNSILNEEELDVIASDQYINNSANDDL